MSARRTATAVAGLVLLAACSSGHPAAAPKPTPTITVGATKVPAYGVGTVGQALDLAGVAVPAGHLLSIKTHRPLGPDASPGEILVNGLPTAVLSHVSAGAVITVERGKDALEPVEMVTVRVPANKGFASLHVGAHPGTERVLRGKLSHEVVSTAVLTQAFNGHLIAPRAIALTFDDGPSPKYTPKILALLAKYHVHATFCLIGRQAQQYPNLVRAIVAGGHTLCNHTWDHNENLPNLSTADITAEMTKTNDAIKKIVGFTPQFFRAPGGAFSSQVESIARSLHMTPLKWSVDPRDWSRPGTQHIEGVVLATVRPGSIVLMHDGGGNRDQTMAAVDFLIPRLNAAHYTYAFPQTA